MKYSHKNKKLKNTIKIKIENVIKKIILKYNIYEK